jgi:hypothetical protein
MLFHHIKHFLKSRITPKVRSVWDMYTQRTQRCAPSPLFQELAELLSAKAQEKPLSTLKKECFL